MQACAIEDNRIVNVIVLDDTSDLEEFDAVPLPAGKWIGDPYNDVPDLVKRVSAVEGTVEAAPQYAAAMRAFAATSTAIADLYALEMPDLFPAWEDLLAAGEALTKGTVLNDGGQLYRVIQDQVIPLEHQSPHGEGMTAVYQPIDRAHAGTREDPIPAKAGMEYIYGRYYLDPEDGRTYLCKRTGEAEGGTVTLQYLPHALVGHYFEAVT